MNLQSLFHLKRKQAAGPPSPSPFADLSDSPVNQGEEMQSAWVNWWAIRQPNEVILLVPATNAIEARALAENTGFRAFGWLENVLRPCLVPGVPRQLLYQSVEGFFWRDQFQIHAGARHQPLRDKYLEWLGASPKPAA